MIFTQIPLPGLIEIASDPEPVPLTAPTWALEHIRETVIAILPDAHPAWMDDTRAGRFDAAPLMQAAIAGWHLARGSR